MKLNATFITKTGNLDRRCKNVHGLEKNDETPCSKYTACN